MSEPKFLKGPWVVGRGHDDEYMGPPGEIAIQAEGREYFPAVALPHGSRGDRYPEVTRANAHLIAAAPDLYEALERTLSWLTSYQGGGALGAWEQASAALAKARGEQP